MRKKGWRVRKKDEDGVPGLEVDVHGLYTATISVDSILYEYSFGFRGEESVDESGQTDDPIREFRRWNRSPEVVGLKREREISRQVRREDMTVPARVSP